MTYDLFSDNEPEVEKQDFSEYEITFPIYVKNRSNDRFTWYKNEQQFEEITISNANESFRGSLMFGFNEQLHDLKYDTHTWFIALLRVHELIERDEYDAIFERLIAGRTEFFDDAIVSQYVERELSTQQRNVKHKWKKLDN